MILLWSLLLQSALATETPGLEKPVDQAIAELAHGQPAQAEELLLAVPTVDPDFGWAFFELQKLRYRRADWKSFFGGMVYYRHQLSKDIVLPELTLLESMALIKHCDFRPAESVLQVVPATAATARGRQVLGDLLAFQRLKPGNVTTEEQRPTAQVFQPAQEWRVKSALSAQLASTIEKPHALKVYVRNRCETSGGGS